MEPAHVLLLIVEGRRAAPLRKVRAVITAFDEYLEVLFRVQPSGSSS